MFELDEYRKEKDRFFKTGSQSPLDPAQRKDFKGLHYFPENPTLHLEVVLEQFPAAESVQMATSTGDIQDYYHVGQFHFQVNGEDAVLQVYVGVDGGDYFIPFVDATAPTESYGAGRYVEAEELEEGKIDVDFNLAYNPYCAYNDLWSCPIPPAQNRLKVRIEAGEKKFHE
jgi:uncharacterized protein